MVIFRFLFFSKITGGMNPNLQNVASFQSHRGRLEGFSNTKTSSFPLKQGIQKHLGQSVILPSPQLQPITKQQNFLSPGDVTYPQKPAAGIRQQETMLLLHKSLRFCSEQRLPSRTGHPELNQREVCRSADAKLLLTFTQQTLPLIHRAESQRIFSIRSFWGFLSDGLRGTRLTKSQALAMLTQVFLCLF